MLHFKLMKANYREIEVDRFERIDLDSVQANYRNRAWQKGRRDLVQLADAAYEKALETRRRLNRPVMAAATESSESPATAPTAGVDGRERVEIPGIDSFSSQGTCFAIDRGGLIVTNHHVIEGTTDVYAKFEGMELMRLTPLRISPANDLAVLRADRTLPAALALSIKGSELGEPVYTLGYPVASLFGGEMKYTNGVVSGTSGFAGESMYLQTTTSIQPGNSGGPLIGSDHTVVGIVTASAAVDHFLRVTGGSLPQGVNFAVKADYLAPLLRGLLPSSKLNALAASSVGDARRSICTVYAR